MQDETKIPQQSEQTQIMVADRSLDEFKAVDEHPAQANGALTDASGYDSEIVEREFAPYENQPNKIYKLWIRVRALTPSELTAIQQKVNRIRLDATRLSALQYQMEHLKPDSRIERNEKTLQELSPDDRQFKDKDDPETAYFDAKEKLQDDINRWTREYAAELETMRAQADAILAQPNYYQTLRAEFFNRVIEDHTMGLPHKVEGLPRREWPLIKVDFSSSDSKHELNTELSGALDEFLWDVLKKEGRAEKQNAKKKSKR